MLLRPEKEVKNGMDKCGPFFIASLQQGSSIMLLMVMPKQNTAYDSGEGLGLHKM